MLEIIISLIVFLFVLFLMFSWGYVKGKEEAQREAQIKYDKLVSDIINGKFK